MSKVAETKSVKRDNPSPADISMDVTQLAAMFPDISMHTMSAALKEMRLEAL